MAHTINTGTVANMLVGLVGIRVGTANDHPILTDQIGYTEDGCQFEYTPNTVDIRVAEEDVPVDTVMESSEVKVSLTMAENTLDNIVAAMMGATSAAQNVVEISQSPSATFVSLLLEGEAPGDNSGIRQILLQRVAAAGTVTQEFRKNTKQMLAVEFTAYAPEDGPVVMFRDFWDETIASGVGCVYSTSKKAIRLAGEGAAADDLDTITPTAGTTGDKLTLLPYSESQVITIKHAATPTTGEFSLTGGTDLTLSDLRHWVEFTLNASSVWVQSDVSDRYA